LIGLEDCVAVSDLVQDALIASNVEFDHLEVSTPGMDRALTKPEHFVRFAGDVVKLTIEPAFESMRKITGTLLGFHDDAVAVEVDGVVMNIPYVNVARARVVPQF
jgi:ribosome maturation factor RimP